MNKFEALLIKSCERLPLGITLYEDTGQCMKPSQECVYCQSSRGHDFCKKRTFTIILEPQR